MERAVFVYTTYPSIVEAEKAGRAIVERRLAACVNILPGMISHYWWEGKVERGEEVVMIVKTRASLAQDVERAVKDMLKPNNRGLAQKPGLRALLHPPLGTRLLNFLEFCWRLGRLGFWTRRKVR